MGTCKEGVDRQGLPELRACLIKLPGLHQQGSLAAMPFRIVRFQGQGLSVVRDRLCRAALLTQCKAEISERLRVFGSIPERLLKMGNCLIDHALPQQGNTEKIVRQRKRGAKG